VKKRLISRFLKHELGDGNWRQAEAWNMPLARAVEVNALA